MLLHEFEQKKIIKRLISYSLILGMIVPFLGITGIYIWINSVQNIPEKEVYATALYDRVVAAESPLIVPDRHDELAKEDPRDTERFVRKVTAVRNFLNSYNAPLASHAEDFIRAAEMHGIDYRLMPAISIIESSGGKHMFKQYNPFGWGRKGYPSFTAAIYDVARGLSIYYKTGSIKPEQIAYRYNPATPKEWGWKARTLMNSMPAL